jgi:cytochrome o ubiquinol oxidase subunit 2
MFGVFDPQGPIAAGERNVIITAILLMLIVAIPLLIAFYTFAWKYRAGNKKAEYEPERVGKFSTQIIWWIIPAIIIFAISILNWQSTHALDPMKPIASATKPITIQVVALQWKWLFIYPEQNIATVNVLEFPANAPVHFELTADGPMSNLWIPQLGGQMAAMAGMANQLNLEANTPGEFAGKNSEINGEGYAGMNFTAKAVSQADFDAWVMQTKQNAQPLDEAAYNALLATSTYNPPAFYSSIANGLYDTIIMKYMVPLPASSSSPTTMPADMPGMTM